MFSPSLSRPLVKRGGAMLGLVAVVLLAAHVTVAVDGPPPVAWNHAPGAAVSARPTAAAQLVSAARIPADRVWKTLTLLELFTGKVKLINVDGKANDLGDYIVFRDQLAHPQTHKILGALDATCVFGHDGIDMCRGSLTLRGRGQIIFEGATPSGSDVQRFAVVGGTGGFVDVGGEVRVDFPGIDFARVKVVLTR